MALTFEELAQLAILKGASDIHVVVGEPPILRVQGVLEVQTDLAIVTPEGAEEIVSSVATAEQQRVFRDLRECDFSYVIQDGTHFRVNLHWQQSTAGLVARLLTANIPSLHDLFMPEITTHILQARQGLILVTGPTGAGKSTSLAAMVNYINQERAEHIVTLEDPIEFVFKPKKSVIRQRQLGTDVLSFAEGLKHVVRQDPNVVVVGEIRDAETVSVVLMLAETGHLVLATLHTPGAIQAIDRIVDMFPPYHQDQARFTLASVLRATIAKRLLPRVSGGRIPAYEVLINTQAVQGIIRENRISQIKSIIQISGKQGMNTMEQALQLLWKAGEISNETFVEAAQ